MKKTLALTLSIMAISLAACQKTAEDKIADTLIEMKNEKKMDRDKEIERMNKIRREGDEAFDKLFPKKTSSSESKKVTKAPDPESK
jgi:protein involved in sex pheromone biosynthesis